MAAGASVISGEVQGKPLWYKKKMRKWRLLKRPRVLYVATYGLCLVRT
jgi:hypothetical protein